jgi:hypothetical protein
MHEELTAEPPFPQEWKPIRNECLKDYKIEIEFLSIGCVIKVGCKSIPFATIKEGMTALNHYIQDPYLVRKLWEERFQKEEEL